MSIISGYKAGRKAGLEKAAQAMCGLCADGWALSLLESERSRTKK